MDAADLAKLTSYDFERLCKDIFDQHLGVNLEIFGPGKDAGIDLRHYAPGPEGARIDDTIVQCNNWYTSGRDALYRHYERTEAAKVRNLQPSRYILATSAVLNPAWKDKLVALLTPHLHGSADIWGGDEITSYLENHPEIIRQHLRLWLSSSAVLQEMLTKDVAIRSRSLKEDIEEALLTYVASPAHAASIEILDKYGVCLISGIPGTGKSTLARALVAQYMDDGYHPIDASHDLTDVDRVWNDDERQIVYIDDFLGHTSLDSRKASSASSQLLPLLRRVKRDPQKRLVMTTRDYIFNEATEQSEELANFGFDPRTCTVDATKFNQHLRAEILYNHIHWSDLTSSQKAEFADSTKYLPVIRHRSYSPRLIEHAITEVLDLEEFDSAVDAVMENLRNPKRLWQKLVEDVLTDDAVGVVLALFTLGPRADAADLEDAWRALQGHELGTAASRNFARCVKRLQRTMLRDVAGSSEGPKYSFQNPSIEDYLRIYLEARGGLLDHMIDRAIGYKQLINLSNPGRGLDGTAWAQAVETRAGAFTAVALGLFPTTHQMDDHFSVIDIANFLLSLANRTGSDAIAEAIKTLTEDEEFYSMSGEEDLSEFVLGLRRSALPQLRSMEADQLDALIDWVDDNSSGWEEGRAAISTLGAHNEHSSVQDLIDRISERLTEEATLIVEPWSEPDAAETDANTYGLQEAVDWLHDTGVSPDGLLEASDYLESRKPPREDTTPSPRADLQGPVELSDMFSSLCE